MKQTKFLQLYSKLATDWLKTALVWRSDRINIRAGLVEFSVWV